MTTNEQQIIYRLTVSALEKEALTKEEIFSRIAEKERFVKSYRSAVESDKKKLELRSAVAQAVESLFGRGLLINEGGRYYLKEAKPVIVRAIKCEKEILTMLAEHPMSKKEIRDKLADIIGTKRTATQKDDNVLFSYLGQILKRLVNEKTLVLYDGVYSISEAKSATVGDMRAMLELKNEFLERLHARGGEFFEHYFLSLLSKYLSKHGKTITESYVTGGSDDGGIDGVIKTVDCLGFKETVMIQTKNRNAHASETEVRSFYGAVCAKLGSRGIFVTSSDFHATAVDFLNSIDNCVGVNGTKIFEMAVECAYGIKRRDNNFIIDIKVI